MRALIVLLSVAAMSVSGVAQQADPANGRMRQSVDLTDSHIEYFVRGQAGDVVVLLPGGSLSVDYMDGLAQELAQAGYRAVSINPRGAGRSTGRSENVTLHDLADDVAGVVRHLKAGPVSVVGHAFGNRVARMLDADYPELVINVVLLAAGGKVPGSPSAEKALGVIFSADATDVERAQAMTYMVGDPANAKQAADALRASRAQAAGPIQYAAATSVTLGEWWAPSGKSRYLILQGSLDQAAPAENGELLKKDLGERAKLVTIEGAGHLMVITYPKVCGREIVNFLRGH